MNFNLKYSTLLLSLLATPVFAGIDKVYSPNVEFGELEIEMRGVHATSGDFHKLKLGIGYGVTEKLFIEGYLIGEKEDGSFEIEEAEIEAKFQLSEQGEYWADFGWLMELEKKLEHDVWEFKAGPIIQKQLGDYLLTTNIIFEKQFGDDKTEDEVEVKGAVQLKYRMGAEFEVGAEYYTDEHTNALGPVLYGKSNFGSTKLKWEAGVLFAMDDETEDATFRWQMEWEF